MIKMVVLDCLGLICPVPLIKAKIEYNKLKRGESIMVITDHSCSSQNIKEYFEKLKCSIKIEEVLNGVWEITITKID